MCREVDKELMDRLLSEAADSNVDVSTYIVDTLQCIKRIKKERLQLHQKLLSLENDYKIARDKVNGELIMLQNDCNHQQRTYYGDASGGNDYFYECDICGKQDKYLIGGYDG